LTHLIENPIIIDSKNAGGMWWVRRIYFAVKLQSDNANNYQTAHEHRARLKGPNL